MNTSDLISIGSRPLLPTARTTYNPESKEALLAKLEASFTPEFSIDYPRYEVYQFEFPGDRTYERYLTATRLRNR
jgi:hypothetical protein